MFKLICRALLFVSLFIGTSHAVDSNSRLIADYSIEQDLIGSKVFEQYYSKLVDIIGTDPNHVPFKTKEIQVKSGDTISSVSRHHCIDHMDAVHLATALYLINKKSFKKGDPNQIVSGSTLTMPTVANLEFARRMYEAVLRTRHEDGSAGLYGTTAPVPKRGETVSAQTQSKAWLNLSNGRYMDFPQKDSREERVLASVVYKEGGVEVSWQEHGISRRASTVAQVDTVFNEPIVEVGMFSTFQAQKSNSIQSSQQLFAELPLSSRTDRWQSNTSAEQIIDPTKAGGFYISAPKSTGEFTSQRKASTSDYDPFESLIDWHFPPTTRVGDAVKVVAAYIGYELQVVDPRVSLTYSRQLPVVHRSVDGLTTSEALELLGGEGLMVSVDHRVRTIKHVMEASDLMDTLGHEVLRNEAIEVCTDDIVIEGINRKKNTFFKRDTDTGYHIVMLGDGAKCLY